MPMVHGFSIGSWHFAAMSTGAVFAFRWSGGPRAREAVLLVFNAYFTALLLGGWSSLAVLFGFIAFVYGASCLRLRGWPGAMTVLTLLCLWLFLFCVRDHEFLGGFNPFQSRPVVVIGISYMVFRSISYFLDFEVLERKDPLALVNYLLFFPSLLSGPIARQDEFYASVLIPQTLNAERALKLSHRLVNGLIKKFVLADSLSVIIPTVENLRHLSSPMLWLGTSINLFVLYLDFSGYCDIVISLAGFMGCQLPENFDHPFRARNIQEFWNRWHMSLSSVIRDYFFMPMAKGLYQRFPRVNRLWLITFTYAFCLVLIAVWHGTNSAWLLYGVLHATALIGLQLQRYFARGKAIVSFRPAEPSGFRVGDVLARAGTYLFVSLTLTLTAFPGASLWPLIRKLLFL